ncbi:MAG: DUF4390 domain-containing protein [Polaromonas sp.]|nr:DUF4390 domain-containing protein [Polaromonas sp.]
MGLSLCLGWLPPAHSASVIKAAHAATAQLSQLRTELTEDGVYLNAAVAFELPHVVEDALLKGIPLFFAIEVDIYRDRWYWTDQRVAGAARTIRLAYQPLTRRWRVNIGSGLIGGGSSGLRATFNQNYDTLSEAMSAVQRVARWKVADSADIRSGSEYNVVFSFKLDLSQLPRPFQIGVAGQRDWNIAVDSTQPLQLQTTRSAEPSKDSATEGSK